jgi:hypothetical protein
MNISSNGRLYTFQTEDILSCGNKIFLKTGQNCGRSNISAITERIMILAI